MEMCCSFLECKLLCTDRVNRERAKTKKKIFLCLQYASQPFEFDIIGNISTGSGIKNKLKNGKYQAEARRSLPLRGINLFSRL